MATTLLFKITPSNFDILLGEGWTSSGNLSKSDLLKVREGIRYYKHGIGVIPESQLKKM